MLIRHARGGTCCSKLGIGHVYATFDRAQQDLRGVGQHSTWLRWNFQTWVIRNTWISAESELRTTRVASQPVFSILPTGVFIWVNETLMKMKCLKQSNSITSPFYSVLLLRPQGFQVQLQGFQDWGCIFPGPVGPKTSTKTKNKTEENFERFSFERLYDPTICLVVARYS